MNMAPRVVTDARRNGPAVVAGAVFPVPRARQMNRNFYLLRCARQHRRALGVSGLNQNNRISSATKIPLVGRTVRRHV
jgi:hypothetical protein